MRKQWENTKTKDCVKVDKITTCSIEIDHVGYMTDNIEVLRHGILGLRFDKYATGSLHADLKFNENNDNDNPYGINSLNPSQYNVCFSTHCFACLQDQNKAKIFFECAQKALIKVKQHGFLPILHLSKFSSKKHSLLIQKHPFCLSGIGLDLFIVKIKKYLPEEVGKVYYVVQGIGMKSVFAIMIDNVLHYSGAKNTNPLNCSGSWSPKK